MSKYLSSTLLFLGFLLALSELVSAKVNTKICRKRNGHFPKPGSFCKAYYKCTNFIPIELLCPPEEHFSPMKLRCDWKELVPCLDKPKRKECPTADGKFLVPGTGCVYYYDCCNGEPTEKKCPQGQLFDPTKKGCELEEHYSCIESISSEEPITSILVTTSRISESTPEEIVPSTDGITEPTSEEIARFTASTRESSSEEEVYHTTSVLESTLDERVSSSIENTDSTLEETVYSTATVDETTPEEIEESTTLISETTFEDATTIEIDETTTIVEEVSSSTENEQITIEPNIMCPEPFGYFPHPTDNHKFVGCVDNIPTVLTCPSDLIYDHEHRQCVYQ